MRRKSDRLLLACTVICILSAAIVAVVSGTVLDTKAITVQIQHERQIALRVNCEDVNDRHDRTIIKLDMLLAARLRKAPAVERERLRASRQTTVLLIETLTPKRDCAALARRLVRANP